eukprot:scaffold14782_cov124-Skeletonema_marinoi.AAC.1
MQEPRFVMTCFNKARVKVQVTNVLLSSRVTQEKTAEAAYIGAKLSTTIPTLQIEGRSDETSASTIFLLVKRREILVACKSLEISHLYLLQPVPMQDRALPTTRQHCFATGRGGSAVSTKSSHIGFYMR